MAERTDASGSSRFFQQALSYNHCFGCGQDNEQGLRILSRWDDDDPELSVCDFEPQPHHSAYPVDVVYGGLIAGLIDCHSICTSIADGYRRAGRPIGDGDIIMYAPAHCTSVIRGRPRFRALFDS
jgi:hypothetical protein